MVESEQHDESSTPTTVGVEVIDPDVLQALASYFAEIVTRNTETAVEDVYVYGSFAEGEAVLHESDLDVIIVVSEQQDERTRERIEYHIRGDEDDITPDNVSHVDPYITAEQPAEDTETVKIG